MLAADFPTSVAHYFNRHRIYDRSGFELMRKLHMDGLKQPWLTSMNNAPRGEAYFDLVVQVAEARKT